MAGAKAGGAELFFERLAIAQGQAGEIVLPVIRADAEREQRLREGGLEPRSFAFGGALDLLTKRRVGKCLRAFAPDITVAWMGRAAQMTPPGDYVLAGRLGGYYDLARFKDCRYLLANTAGLKKWIIGQGFDAGRVFVVPNFVADHRGAVAADLPVPAGCKIVLGLGRLHRNKGFDVLIAALTRLPESVHAVIAGSGPEGEDLRTLAARAGLSQRVHFLGWRQDVANLMAAADVFVCSSRSEVLGNMVLDAFSAQKPVVATMADGPMELIEPGKNGVLVPVDSAIALAAGIEGVLDMPVQADAMAKAGRAVFEARYSEIAVLAAWRQTLAGLVAA